MANNIECNFEEVYKNGQIQQGIFLLGNNKLRYEYNDQNLFTILFNEQWEVVANKDKKILDIKNIDLEILKEINQYLQMYPDIPEEIIKDNYEILFYKTNSAEFIKSITIKSPKMNMRVHFFNCKSLPSINLYFLSEPFFEYNKK